MSEPTDRSDLAIDDINPDHVNLLLEQTGWERRGGRPGSYSRWVLPTVAGVTEPASVIIPLDRRNADFTELLEEALSRLRQLASTHRPWAMPVLRELTHAPGDELRFRKNIPTTRGAVPWSAGEELFSGARGILVAGAKARLSRQAYYGQKNGRFAKRFLESVLMGQTEEGSYIVTAFTPPTQKFPERETQEISPPFSDVPSYTGREITETVVSALTATEEALEHFQNTNSLSAFTAGVQAGVSRELTESLHSIVRDTTEAEVEVLWSLEPVMIEDARPADRAFVFTGNQAPILERASLELSTATPSEYVQVTGWVSVVARPKRGEPGLIRLKVISGSEAATLQVRLNEEQFEIATTAIAQELGLSVTGRQEREGNRYWLYNASRLRTVELSDDPASWGRERLID